MKREEIRVLIVRAPGTNCDSETALAFQSLGTKVDVVPFSRLIRNPKTVLDYDIFVIPGGFSYGDYVRAGAVLGKKLISKLGDVIKEFIRLGKPILGICNGFQVLVESGLIPGREDLQVSLTTNMSMHYECRWVFLRFVNKSRCGPLSYVPRDRVLQIPVGHGEGRLVTTEETLEKLIEDDLVVFRYCRPDGDFAEGEYPWNPNGSMYDIASLCNVDGNVIGMMPHPERAFFFWQLPDWTRYRKSERTYGDGYIILESIVKYVEVKF